MICNFRNLRMKQQALLIQGSIILLVLTIITSFVMPTSMYEIEIIKTQSHEALLKSNDAKVSQLSYKIKTLIDQAFLQTNLTLNKAQLLYINNVKSYYELTRSKNIMNDGYLLTYWQPQSPDQNTTINNFQQFRNLLSQLDQFLLSFQLEYQSNIQFLLRIQKPHITSVFSQVQNLSTTFNIETRPYYTEHIQQNQTRIIGSPFISSGTLKVSLVVSQTIFDIHNNKDVIMIMGFQFDNLSKYLSLNNIKFVLCTLEGIIVSSNINNTQQVQTFKELTYIYNQTIFPFTRDDWIQMNRYLQNRRYQSNCEQSFIKFCRNLDGNDIQLEAQFIQAKFISIIFNDLSFTKQEAQLLNKNINELLIIAMELGLAYFSWCFFVLLISTIIITKIIKPVCEMINIVELQIESSSLHQEEFSVKQIILKTNIFIQLSHAFISFIERHMNYKQQKVETLNKQNYPLLNNVILNTTGIENIINKPFYIKRKSAYFNINVNQKTQIVNKFILQKIDQIIQEY